MNDKLQQIRNILASHFGLTDEWQDGTYLYHLTRDKEAFHVGTMTLDDFVEVDEDFLNEVFEDIKPIIEQQQQEIERLQGSLQQAQAKAEKYKKALREIANEQEVGEGDFNAADIANNLIATAKEALEG